MKCLLVALCAFSAASAPTAHDSHGVELTSQAAPTAAQTTEIVEELADALTEYFVFPATGVAYAAMLRERLEGGLYYSQSSPDALAEALTSDLLSVQADGHLRVFPPKVSGTKQRYRTEPDAVAAIGEAGWVGEGIAYIEFTVFPGDEGTLVKIKEFLDTHASAKVLIIDLRAHNGGDIREADLIASYLFSEEVTFAHMDTREAVEAAGLGAFEDGPTLRRIQGEDGVVRRAHIVVPGPDTPLRQAQVFLLTSQRTVSAGEAFVLGMKRSGRATVIGERTRGAGHFGDPYPLPNGYSVFIPSGRTFDPTTGEGWEGRGILPDLEIPAEEALEEALRRANSGSDGVGRGVN